MLTRQIIDSAYWVSNNSTDVSINESNMASFISNFQEFKNPPHLLDNLDFNTVDEKIKFLVLFNSINFCFWTEPEINFTIAGKEYSRSEGIKQCLYHNLYLAKDLNSETLNNINFIEFSNIFFNKKLNLLKTRYIFFKETAGILSTKFPDTHIDLVKSINAIDQLIDIIVNNFPCFFDSSIYNSRLIPFFKRAQVLAYQISSLPDITTISGEDKLTLFADYRVPQILRHHRLLQYSTKLARNIDNLVQIPQGSNPETEIRANSIVLGELIKKYLKDQGINLSAPKIDQILWMMAKTTPGIKPHHRTLSTSY